jgi:hypothetical protein
LFGCLRIESELTLVVSTTSCLDVLEFRTGNPTQCREVLNARARSCPLYRAAPLLSGLNRYFYYLPHLSRLSRKPSSTGATHPPLLLLYWRRPSSSSSSQAAKIPFDRVAPSSRSLTHLAAPLRSYTDATSPPLYRRRTSSSSSSRAANVNFVRVAGSSRNLAAWPLDEGPD